MNIGILASGNGSNAEAIIKSVNSGYIPDSEIKIIITNNPDAFVIKRARNHSIECLVMAPPKGMKIFTNNSEKLKSDKYTNNINRDPVRVKYNENLVAELNNRDVELVTLAGWNQLITENFVDSFTIMNIHPSLLPAFKGNNAIKRAFDYGVKISGVTVHYVDKGMDTGEIIYQKEVYVGNDFNDFKGRIHETEHKLYSRAIRDFVRGDI